MGKIFGAHTSKYGILQFQSTLEAQGGVDGEISLQNGFPQTSGLRHDHHLFTVNGLELKSQMEDMR